MRVGFIGLGSEGAPMARRILEGGYPTTLWARRTATLEQFAGTTANFAASPSELAADSDLLYLCVVGDNDVEEITGGDDGLLVAMKPGGVIAVHSTVHPNTCLELAKKAAAQRVSVIDAHVSGGAPAAAPFWCFSLRPEAATVSVTVSQTAVTIRVSSPPFRSVQ